tara:strand:- start:210 stop:440 length:231 start_codon:yes stop_codon:yes gene_type:complete
MIETTVKYGNMIHSDKTVAKKTVMKCDNLDEFHVELEKAFSLDRTKNTTTANIEKMSIETISYIPYFKIYRGDEEE